MAIVFRAEGSVVRSQSSVWRQVIPISNLPIFDESLAQIGSVDRQNCMD